MELTDAEVRVLGCLLEKEATTPESYPLSTNALLAACNQRSSRDPVVDFDESTVTAALIALRERGLARTARGEGSRVYKHAHGLGAALGLGRPELAVLAVLMLRGPQTVGELRTRAERQCAFGSLDEVEAALAGFAVREPPLAERLARQPGQKEARWRHLLGSGEPGVPPPAVAPAPARDPAGELEALRRELAALRARLDALEERLG